MEQISKNKLIMLRHNGPYLSDKHTPLVSTRRLINMDVSGPTSRVQVSNRLSNGRNIRSQQHSSCLESQTFYITIALNVPTRTVMSLH